MYVLCQATDIEILLLMCAHNSAYYDVLLVKYSVINLYVGSRTLLKHFP